MPWRSCRPGEPGPTDTWSVSSRKSSGPDDTPSVSSSESEGVTGKPLPGSSSTLAEINNAGTDIPVPPSPSLHDELCEDHFVLPQRHDSDPNVTDHEDTSSATEPTSVTTVLGEDDEQDPEKKVVAATAGQGPEKKDEAATAVADSGATGALAAAQPKFAAPLLPGRQSFRVQAKPLPKRPTVPLAVGRITKAPPEHPPAPKK